MKAYLRLLKNVIKAGENRVDRTGVGVNGVFGRSMRFNLKKGFPIVTTKYVHFKSVVHEVLWFLSGSTNTAYLTANGVTIWNEWADEKGDLGPVYGKQWRNFNGVDQVSEAIKAIKTDPFSRRILVSSWNPADIKQMALPPCHTLFQFYVHNATLSCQLYQR